MHNHWQHNEKPRRKNNKKTKSKTYRRVENSQDLLKLKKNRRVRHTRKEKINQIRIMELIDLTE